MEITKPESTPPTNPALLTRALAFILRLPVSERAAGALCVMNIATGLADAGYACSDQPDLKILIGGLKLTFFFLGVSFCIRQFANSQNTGAVKALASAYVVLLTGGILFHTLTEDSHLPPGLSYTKLSTAFAAVAGACAGAITTLQIHAAAQTKEEHASLLP